jgi:hypothetical protein
MSAQLRFTVVVAVVVSAFSSLAGCGQQSAQQTSQEVGALRSADDSDAAASAESGDDGRKIRTRPEAVGEAELDYVPEDTYSRDDADAGCEVPSQIMLTAGSLDDARNVAEFRDYVATALRAAGPGHSGLLHQWNGQRIEIMVRNDQGKPVPDALVRIFQESEADDSIQLKYQPIVEAAESPVLVASLRTGSDGRTHFLPGIDHAQQCETWDVEISTPDGELRVRQESLSAPEAWWDFAVGRFPSQMPQQLDLALVIDTTGSMGDELEYLKLEISNIAAQVERLCPGIRQRFALILYRDNGDRYVTRNFDFTESLSEFQQTLSAQHAGGGGDYPEAMHVALEQAGELSWRDRNTARMMFLVGDAPPHRRHMQRTFEAVQKLRLRDVAIFPIAGSGTRDEAEFALRTAAFLTMGQYLFLTDHSGIGLPHAAPHAAEYNVEWLSSVMLRMIASELSGRDVLPSEILATEETGGHVLAQSVPRDPNAMPHDPSNDAYPARCRMPIPLLPAALWSENRPLIALVLLFLLAMAERFFARRPARFRNDSSGQ